jgi:hypothetical protein
VIIPDILHLVARFHANEPRAPLIDQRLVDAMLPKPVTVALYGTSIFKG